MSLGTEERITLLEQEVKKGEKAKWKKGMKKGPEG